MASIKYYLDRHIKWDGDVMKVDDRVYDKIRDDVKRLDDATNGEIINHFECDLSDFRDYLRDREEWRQRQRQKNRALFR